MSSETPITLKLGLGGIINFEVLTFDALSGKKFSPYLCEILGRDFKYGFKREFVEKKHVNYTMKAQGRTFKAITFAIKRHTVYEYKRFPDHGLGEIVEGYFVVLSDRILELEYEEVLYWCGTAKDKEKALKARKEKVSKGESKFAPDDIDF